MGETGTAKLFRHGRSQAVRLPKEFRMPGTQVRVRRIGRGVLLDRRGLLRAVRRSMSPSVSLATARAPEGSRSSNGETRQRDRRLAAGRPRRK
jgi:Antidote-toxin recognition MazE, bacterial antitoxin